MSAKSGKIRTQTREKAKVLRDRIDRPVVVTGMMGAGKSRIGRLLAQALGLTFIDTDSEVESAAGCTVADIFERFGEKTFREAESRAMRRALESGPCVIATGGGTLMNAGLADLVADKAFSLWLRAEPDLILARTAEQGTRPLLRADDPGAVLRDLIAQRTPVYARADAIVDVHDAPVEKTLHDVVEALHDFFFKA